MHSLLSRPSQGTNWSSTVGVGSIVLPIHVVRGYLPERNSGKATRIENPLCMSLIVHFPSQGSVYLKCLLMSGEHLFQAWLRNSRYQVPGACRQTRRDAFKATRFSRSFREWGDAGWPEMDLRERSLVTGNNGSRPYLA